jgi:hypothetical protein
MTRDEILALDDRPVLEYTSGRWGVVKYRPVSLKEKALCRRRSMVEMVPGKPEVDNERLEALLVIQCCIEPKFEPNDVDMLLDKNGREVSKISGLILELPNR